MVRRGALGDGDLLPSTRALAAELGVSRTSVIGAYDELTAAGFATGRAGSGTRITRGASAAALAHPEQVRGVRADTRPVLDTETIRWDSPRGIPTRR